MINVIVYAIEGETEKASLCALACFPTLVSFGVKGGRPAAEKFMKNMTLGAIETHVADARTCCLHPASATHRQMNDQELRAAGVSPDLIRFSCGIEDADDLIADIKQALDKI